MFHIIGILDRDGFHFEHDDWMCPNCHGDGDDASAPEGVCRVCGGNGKRRWAGCDVRVRYSYKASEKSVLNEDAVRDHFVGALRLKVEGVAIPDRELRAPEVAAAKTLPEKLAAMRKQDALPVSIAEKLAWLERADADRLLVDVAARIRSIEMPQDVQVAA
jgi:hypothetical protein